MQLLIYLRDNLLQFCGLLSGRGRTRTSTGREKGRLHKFDAQRDEWRVQARKCISLSLSVVLSSFELSFSLYVGAGRSRGRGNCVSGTVGVLATKTNFAFQQISACHLQWRFLLCSSCGIFWSGAHEGGLLKSFECLFSNAACVLIRMRCF